jgi:transcriptional regulator with XRE-family HTH domain
MYNGKRIKELLEERGQNNSALLSALGLDPKKNSLKTVINGNPTANRLEQVADFFGVAIDEFFIRENRSVPSPVDTGISRLKELELEVSQRDKVLLLKDEIIKEKEERIKLLEALNSVYSSQLSGN